MAPSTTGVALPAVPASSPHSLGEASHHDTPSTNLTAYSPTTDDVANVIKGRSKVKVTEAHETESVDSDDRTA